MRESSIERKLRFGVEAVGGKCLKFVSPGHSGVPDRIVLLPNGGVVFVELKAEGGRLSEIQKEWLGILKAMGFDARCLKGSEEVAVFLKEVRAWVFTSTS